MQQGFLGQWWRVGGALGLAFIIVFIIAGFGVQGETPMYDDSIDEIRAYWEDDGDAYLLGDYILGLVSFLFLLPFLVCLKALLGRAEGGPQIWSQVGFYGGLLVVAVAAAASASWAALAFAPEAFDDATMTALMYLDIAAWNAFPFAIGIFVLFSSIVMAMTGVLWKWLGYLGIIIGVLALITPLGFLDADSEDVFDIVGFIPFIGFALWMLATSIGMLMRKEEPSVVEAHPMDSRLAV